MSTVGEPDEVGEAAAEDDDERLIVELVVTAIALAVFSGWQSGWILMLRENARHARKADYE